MTYPVAQGVHGARHAPTGADPVGAYYAAVPLASDLVYYVGAGANASDSNNGLTPGSAFATIAHALTQIPAGTGATAGGRIQLGHGNFTISAADANNNAITLASSNTVLEGLGEGLTTITIAKTGLTWGIVANAAQCVVRNLSISVTAAVAPYWVIGVTVAPGSAAESCKFENVLGAWASGVAMPTIPGGTSTVPPGFFALGPDNPGSSTVDIAFTLFSRCRVFNQTGGTITGVGFVLGNGTQGNVLAPTFVECQVNFCAYGVAHAGCGAKWVGGGMSGNTTADITILKTCGDPISYYSLRGENGNQVFQCGGIGALFAGGVLLDNCTFGNYTVTGAGTASGRLVTFNTQGSITLRGGSYACSTTNANVGLNVSAGGFVSALICDGALFDNATPFPAASAYLSRSIHSAMYLLAGVPTPIPGFQAVTDGPITYGVYTTTARNALTGIVAGATVFDSTLGYLVTYTGSVWHNQAGTTV